MRHSAIVGPLLGLAGCAATSNSAPTTPPAAVAANAFQESSLPASCSCDPPRALAAGEQLGDRTVAAQMAQLSRTWHSKLTWAAREWFRIETPQTQVAVTLQRGEAQEIRCAETVEALSCGGGRFLRATLSVRTADNLLQLELPVRVHFLPSALVSQELPLPESLAQRRLRSDIVGLHVVVEPSAEGIHGQLIAVAITEAGERHESTLATWE